DAQGATVPGATVSAVQKATGIRRTTMTDDVGVFTMTQLPPGIYDLTVEAQGFSKSVVQNFELNVGTKPTVSFELKPGPISQEVTVIGAAPLLETTKSELGGVVTPSEVQNLPLLNRTFANLSVVMPEARPAGAFDPTKARVGNFAM